MEPDDATLTRWSLTWWDLPFDAVLRHATSEWSLLCKVPLPEEPVVDAGGLRELLAALAVRLDPDPLEIARENRAALERTLQALGDLARTWREIRNAPIPASMPREPVVDDAAWLQPRSAGETLRQALALLDDPEFAEAARGCESLEGVRTALGLSEDEVARRREERERQRAEVDRQARRFEVAGETFELDSDNLQDLLRRVSAVCLLEGGPDPRKRETTPLDGAPGTRRGSNGGGGGGDGGGGGRRPRPTPQAKRMVGIVGEMRAWRWLRQRFGEDVVAAAAWVSECRLEVLPLLPDETNDCSDGLGYDFRFDCDGRTWHVEVKATAGDDFEFELGSSQVRAAHSLAGQQRASWYVLRVRNALSTQPEFDWLPNPFEYEHSDRYLLKDAGTRVAYRLRRNR